MVKRISIYIDGANFVYECLNSNPFGAKEVYKEIAEETKGAYD